MGAKLQGKMLASLGKIAGLGGIALGVFLLIFRSVLEQQVLQQAAGLNSSQAFVVLFSAMILTFGMAGVGVISWLISKGVGPQAPVSSTAITVLATLFALVVGAAVYVAQQRVTGPIGPIADGATLKEDPTPGILTPGTKVFVDDQTCPSDQIKRITSGDAARSIVRAIACVPKKCSVDRAILHSTEC